MKRYYSYDIKEAHTFTELENSDFYKVCIFKVDGSEYVEYLHKDFVQTLLDDNHIKPLELGD